MRAHTLVVVCCGVVGGLLGLLIAQQYDIIFNIDAGIVGCVAGAILGSLVLPRQIRSTALRVLAAALGVAIPEMLLIGSGRVAPEVLFGMIGMAMIGAGAVSVIYAVTLNTLLRIR